MRTELVSLRLSRALLLVSALFSFSGCTTTGDPREGGLFGWSEEKAAHRIENFDARAHEAREEADAVARETSDLEGVVESRQREVESMATSVKKLVAENRELRAEFLQLVSQQASLSDELRDLQERLRATEQGALWNGNRQRATERLAAENQELHEAILFMLE